MAQSRSARLRVRPAPVVAPQSDGLGSSSSPTLQFRSLSNASASSASGTSANSSKRNSAAGIEASTPVRGVKRASLGSKSGRQASLLTGGDQHQQPLTPPLTTSPRQAFQNYNLESAQMYSSATGVGKQTPAGTTNGFGYASDTANAPQSNTQGYYYTATEYDQR